MSALSDRITRVHFDHRVERVTESGLVYCHCAPTQHPINGLWAHSSHVAVCIRAAMREDGIVGFVRNDAPRVPRVYTDADAEAWSDL